MAKRRYKTVHPKKEAFLAALSECGNIGQAAVIAKVARISHYRWLEADPRYKGRFDAAMEEACDLLEKEARRRAVEGVDEPVFYKGSTCGVVRKFSDTLLMFLLNGERPWKFRQRFEHSGPNGGPIRIAAEELADDELAAIAARGSARTVAKAIRKEEPT